MSALHAAVMTRLQPLGMPVFRSLAPQSQDLPYIVISEVAALETWHLAGAADLLQTRLQVDCYASDPTSVYDLYLSARALLQPPGDDFSCGGIDTIGELTELEIDAHRYAGDFNLWHNLE